MTKEMTSLSNLAFNYLSHVTHIITPRQLLSGRALLECPSCGLHEDVRADMTLVTVAAEAPDLDTGLSFAAMDEEGAYWWCPGCGQPFAADRGVD